MSTPALFTVKIYHLPNTDADSIKDPIAELQYIEEFYNMLSAKIVKVS